MHIANDSLVCLLLEAEIERVRQNAVRLAAAGHRIIIDRLCLRDSVRLEHRHVRVHAVIGPRKQIESFGVVDQTPFDWPCVDCRHDHIFDSWTYR